MKGVYTKINRRYKITMEEGKSVSKLLKVVKGVKESVEDIKNKCDIQTEQLAALNQSMIDLQTKIDLVLNAKGVSGIASIPARGSPIEKKKNETILTFWKRMWREEKKELTEHFKLSTTYLNGVKKEFAADINKKKTQAEKDEVLGRRVYNKLSKSEKDKLRTFLAEHKRKMSKMEKMDSMAPYDAESSGPEDAEEPKKRGKKKIVTEVPDFPPEDTEDAEDDADDEE